MNKLLAILFAFGMLACLILSRRESYPSQPTNHYGMPVGQATTVTMTSFERNTFRTLGFACMAVCIYFVAQSRRDDLR